MHIPLRDKSTEIFQSATYVNLVVLAIYSLVWCCKRQCSFVTQPTKIWSLTNSLMPETQLSNLKITIWTHLGSTTLRVEHSLCTIFSAARAKCIILNKKLGGFFLDFNSININSFALLPAYSPGCMFSLTSFRRLSTLDRRISRRVGSSESIASPDPSCARFLQSVIYWILKPRLFESFRIRHKNQFNVNFLATESTSDYIIPDPFNFFL